MSLNRSKKADQGKSVDSTVAGTTVLLLLTLGARNNVAVMNTNSVIAGPEVNKHHFKEVQANQQRTYDNQPKNQANSAMTHQMKRR